MIRVSSIVGFVLLYTSIVFAAPTLQEDSAIGGEVAVSAPDGIPMSDTPSPTVPSSSGPWVTPPAIQTPSPWPDVKGSQSPGYTESVPPSSATTPNYGSGSNNYGGGFDYCVQQCQAQFGGGSPPGSASPYPPATTPPPGGSSSPAMGTGTPTGGATHTVIVAPSQGVLRYVPFAVNASIGDTVKFVWGANNHTVTKSSELSPCNKSSDPGSFTSGVQSKDFVFEQVVNDTNPTFFYCGVPTHCQKGMFGIVNPPNALGASGSVGSMIPAMAANDSEMGSMVKYANNATSGHSVASGWGQNIDLSALPEWSQRFAAEGVLYTQVFLAANPDAVKSDGTVDVGMGGHPALVPEDIAVAAANYTTPNSSLPSSSLASPNPSGSTATASSSNNAFAVSHSGALVGFVTLSAGFFLL